jgi:CRP-like cAMP-binding protein
MAADADRVRSMLVPRDLDRDQIQILERAWREVALRTGETLWEQGAAAGDLGLLVAGDLRVFVDGEEIGAVQPGDVVGEASAFTRGAHRSATLQAHSSCRLLAVDPFELDRLCQALPAFHERVLDLGLRTVAKRIRATDARIARLSQGVLPAPVEQSTTGIARLWRVLRQIGRDAQLPPIAPLLRRQPGLKRLTDPVLEGLAAGFQPHAFSEGDMLIREGEQGDFALLLAVGELQVLRHVRHRMADVLATFQPGGLLGTLTLAVPGPRTASCVAGSAGWVYRLDRPAFEALSGRALIAWKECMLASLGLQLRNANALLAGFQAGSHEGGPLPEPALQRLLQAAGALQGLTA